MARRGRKPEPEQLRILKGLPAGRGAGSIAPGRPELPEHLDQVARDEWSRMIPILESMGILSEDSGPALSAYCAAFSRYREAEALIRAEGIVIPTARGGRVAHPATRVSRDAAHTMLKVLSEFGCTPASRRGANVRPPQEPDELDEFLAKAPAQRQRRAPDAS